MSRVTSLLWCYCSWGFWSGCPKGVAQTMVEGFLWGILAPGWMLRWLSKTLLKVFLLKYLCHINCDNAPMKCKHASTKITFDERR